MSIKFYRPTTPSRRQMSVSGFDGVDKKAKPERSLTEVKKKHSGRNNHGRITVRHRGGANRRKFRIIDFKRKRMDEEATVLRLEYDPNRSHLLLFVSLKTASGFTFLRLSALRREIRLYRQVRQTLNPETASR